MNKITIAIDGYSSCGKSTIAKDLAHKLDYIYIDTGAMYRAVTLYCLQNHIITKDGVEVYKIEEFLDDMTIGFQCDPNTKKCEVYLNDENVEQDIRGLIVANNVSFVASFKEVREKLVSIQRELGKNKGVVMDGRDIGTNVFPDAELKIFMTADPLVRAKRRFDELTAKGERITLDEVKKNLEERDDADTHRKESPLQKAADAVVLDNTLLNREQQLEFVLQLMKDKLN